MDFSKFRRNRAQEDAKVVLWLEDPEGHLITIVRLVGAAAGMMGTPLFEVRGCDERKCYSVQTTHPENLMTKEFAIVQMKIAMGKKKRHRIKF